MTRALIISALYPPAVGGAAAYLGEIAPRLAQRSEIGELIILTERLSGQPRDSRAGKLRVLRYLPTRVSRPRRSLAEHLGTYAFTQLWFAARLSRLVRSCEVDIVHYHTRYRGRLFYAALGRSCVPVLADLRDKVAEPARLAHVADRLLCCGEGVQRFAVEGGFPAERVVLVPIPFAPPDVPSAEEVLEARQRYALGDGPYLLFVGDITDNKGVYDLLEAYRRWRREHPDVQLVLAGTNREGARFRNEVERTMGSTYLGPVPHEDALALMLGAEIVALPSRSEGLPRVILEAVALGTKVICPPGIPEFERHLARFCLPRVDAGAIMETLSNVWDQRNSPSYPFARHRVRHVVNELARVYCADAENQSG